jgi:hypothetical protein
LEDLVLAESSELGQAEWAAFCFYLMGSGHTSRCFASEALHRIGSGMQLQLPTMKHPAQGKKVFQVAQRTRSTACASCHHQPEALTSDWPLPKDLGEDQRFLMMPPAWTL